jgi:hypothetical protein
MCNRAEMPDASHLSVALKVPLTCGQLGITTLGNLDGDSGWNCEFRFLDKEVFFF